MIGTLDEQARALVESALEHRRLAHFHRRRTQKTWEELEAFCRTHGISIHRYKKPQSGEGDTLHGREPAS